MSWNTSLPIKRLIPKRKVFISFHSKDIYYKNRFESLFGHLFVNKSVKFGGIDSDLDDSYVKRLIREDYLTDSSVCVVLVGLETYCRKHVDWEISAALNKKTGGYSGLLGLCLPTHPDFVRDVYNPDIVPLRLVDNLKSGYANLYNWTENEEAIKARVEIAFENRISKAEKIENWRTQFSYNRCG
jgi:hypothetical protein